MTDEKTGENVDETVNDGGTPATTEEISALIKSQAERIKQLEAENAGIGELKSQVEELQATLGTQSSLSELVDQLKTLNAAGKGAISEEERAMSDLQKAAEAGDMKTYRKLRTEQQA